jgi:hypothetical protein
MPAWTARFLAIPCGIVAIALAFWTDWFWPGDGSLSSKALILVATAGVPFALYILVTLPVSRRPSSFAVKRNRFFAPLEPQRAGLNIIIWMLFGGSLLATTDNLQAGAIMAAGFFLMAAAWLIIWRPWIALTPTGLVVQRFRRRVVVAWDDIAPGEPAKPRKRRPRSLNLYLKGEPLYGTIPLCEEVPVGSFFVDAAFLVAAIRYYAEHPEHRAGIGTETEHARLVVLLGKAEASSGESLAQLA